MTKIYLYTFLLGPLMLLHSFEAKASDYLNEGAFFSRCYSAMTGSSPSFSHPLLIDSIKKNDHKNTIANCMAVLDKARLKNTSYSDAGGDPSQANIESLGLLSDESDTESIQVLNNFTNYFASFFIEKDYSNAPQTYSGRHEMLDASEDALYYIRALFEGDSVAEDDRYTNHFPVDGIMTSKKSIVGKRVMNTRNAHRVGVCDNWGQNCEVSPIQMDYTVTMTNWWDVPEWHGLNGLGPLPGEGPLVGYKVFPEGDSTYYSASGEKFDLPEMPRSRGGGIIGATSYMFKNAQYSGSANGEVHIRRRAIRNLYDAVLCREDPPLPINNSLVLERVASYRAAGFPESKSWQFRTSTICASCHVSFDEGAAVYRNITVNHSGTTTRIYPHFNIDLSGDGYLSSSDYDDYYDSGDFMNYFYALVEKGVYSEAYLETIDDEYTELLRQRNSTYGMDIYTAAFHTNVVDSGIIPEPVFINGTHRSTADPASGIYKSSDYIASRPEGYLNFTNYRGELISVYLPASTNDLGPENAGIIELGEAIAETDQFYMCLAKRMFRHFTKINIPIEDDSDTRIANRGNADSYYLEEYLEPLALGQEGIKSHKSLRKMIKNIISLDMYRRKDLRSVK